MKSKKNSDNKPTVFILDVDGVMTNGQFFYTSKGKEMKVFGPDDNDGLSLLKNLLQIRFISGDKRGFQISKKRIVDDMGYKLDLVNAVSRLEWIAEHYSFKNVIYMGDGIFDHYVMKKVAYSIAPSNADKNCKEYASFVTLRAGGDRAVAEAALHILEKFFKPYNPDVRPINQMKLSGAWKA